MKKIRSGFLYPLTGLIILVYALSSQLFDVFPLGKMLNPFIGVMQNGNDRALTGRYLAIPGLGLSDTVRIFFDERKVPHVYAGNTDDLYFAQGYVTAALRLWQMDFLTYAAAGRLSEIFRKSEFLDYDRNQRRVGIPDAAKKSLRKIEEDPGTMTALNAYSKGVNAYIRTLDYASMPLEYKLLDYKPEPWSNLKSMLILKSMANSLTGFGEDLFLSKMMLALGEEGFNQLFPDFDGHSTPVMNSSKPPSAGAMSRIRKPAYLDYSFFSSNTVIDAGAYNPRLGSNSWAVSGKKTRSGRPILASDPHLGLSFPSVWIEMQLCAPGMNVYGVSIPGTPAIVIGYNEDIAWGLTNGADDVKDWYKLKISTDYKKYWLDGRWRDLPYRVEEIRRKDNKVFLDTVYSTVYGPIVNNKSFPGHNPDLMDNALRWGPDDPSDDLQAFIQLNSARNYNDYKEAIRYYASPLQNFTFACKDNTISINHQGSMAIKSPGQGKFIQDGTLSANMPSRYIPADSLPHLYNPLCGYVLSANQHPTYPNYPYYYDGSYAEARANRIGQLLENRSDLDIPGMEAIQLDNINSFAVEALPVITGCVNRAALEPGQQKALTRLSDWKGNYDLDDSNALLYELWWENITDYTWDELKNYRFYVRPPEKYVLLNLIQNDPDNPYFDEQNTSKKETAADVVTEAFKTASDRYDRMKSGGSVQWGERNKVNLMHLINLPAFSIMNLASAGHPDAINAMSANWGPSWRMIVQLGDRPVGYGIYPGGQSGNEGSFFYDDFVKDWNQGKYYPLHFFMSIAEARKQTATRWSLK